jgi:hypothetical protein
VAAAAAILAIAISGAYLFGNFRAPVPGASSSAATSTASSPTSPPESSPSRAGTKPQPTVTQLLGSSWRLVSGAFPQMVAGPWEPFQPTVFELTTGASVGFVAFVPCAAGGANHRPGDAILAAFTTAGPSAPISWETRVFESTDGVSWTERSSLPSDAATVTAVAESGGNIVAVGWTGETPTERATTWTTTDLKTWHSAELPTPPQSHAWSNADGVAAGPTGFLAWGYVGSSSRFWMSKDGETWNTVSVTGLPAEPLIETLYGVSGGWVISGELADRSAVWRSSDGTSWTQTWTGPSGNALSGIEYSWLGPIVRVPDGSFISFGSIGMAEGQPSTPHDLLVWTSPDMTHWTASARIAAPGWMNGFATVPGGYVAAGAQPSEPWLESWGSLGVWTSPDGRSWQPLAGLPSVSSIEVLTAVSDGTRAIVVCVDQAGNLQLLVGDGLQ